MGTNYYLKYNVCSECGRHDELHIGKSSAGWKFIFHGYDDCGLNITDIDDWKTRTAGGKIFNEYGEEVKYSWFWELVENKQTNPHNRSNLHLDSNRREYYDKEGYWFNNYDFS